MSQKNPSLSGEKDTESSSKNVESKARKDGRRLKLFFTGPAAPIILHRIEFRLSKEYDLAYRQQRDPVNSFQWREVPKALSLIFLEYVVWDRAGRKGEFFFDGPDRQKLARTLGKGMYKPNDTLFGVFCVRNGKEIDNCALSIFQGQNVAGNAEDDKEQRITINLNFLPADCIEVYWNKHGKEPLTKPKILNELVVEFRKTLEIPEAPPKPAGEGEPEKPEQPEPAAPKEKLSQPGFKQKTPQTALELFPVETGAAQPKEKLPKPDAEPSKTPDLPEAKPQTETPPIKDTPAQKPKPLKLEVEPPKAPNAPEAKPQPGAASPKADVQIGEWAIQFKKPATTAQPKPEPKPVEFPAPEPQPPIDPRLFQIQNPQGHTWDDYEELLNFGNDESDADVWRIRDACEGTLIFGAVGSGKTSGSGSAIARAFLQVGFGGLVLTAKPDEARRWLRMCQETGRTEDLIHLTPGSGHNLNFLQYETQRPGKRLAVSDDLIALFRCLLDVISHSRKSGGTNEEFWTNTTDQLMRKLFNVFLLAGEPLSLDRLVRFLNHAPKDLKTNWRADATFGRVIALAEDNVKKGTDEDKRIFQEAFEYWTQDYPLITEGTRSGIITSFSAMADNLSGRGIHEMIGTTTNLTPEMILSGKVVVLDIPLKGNVQSGLMVQAIWKLLFQQAVERRADKGLPTARPAFLWEDEGHLFFSPNDTNFQPTARDIRAPHVIISQNLHNFLQQGHNEHSFYAVFAAMNTYLFHTNGDLETNQWASAHIGEIRKSKLTTDGLLRPMRDKDYSFLQRRPEEVENVGKMRIEDETKPSMPPEDFAKLKRGGDGTCEAVLVWLSHQFAANRNRNFCVLTFEQEPRPA